MTDHTLLPCPFCGGEAHLFDGYWVECTKCGCQTPETFEEVAISAWNRRIPSAVPDGWVMAPKEPTPEMCNAALKELSDITVRSKKAAAWDAVRAYRAMLSAAPTPPVEDVSKTVKQRAWEIADQLWLDTDEKSKLARLICDAFSASPTPPVDERP